MTCVCWMTCRTRMRAFLERAIEQAMLKALCDRSERSAATRMDLTGFMGLSTTRDRGELECDPHWLPYETRDGPEGRAEKLRSPSDADHRPRSPPSTRMKCPTRPRTSIGRRSIHRSRAS